MSLAGNAQYWYGETFRVRQLYQDAATAYLDGYQKYPKSSKAPVNLLKLGVMLSSNWRKRARLLYDFRSKRSISKSKSICYSKS